MTETDIVSGKPVKGRETYRGAWPIAYKASPFNLTSNEYGYDVKVNYWMPFVYGQDFMMRPGSHPLAGTVIKLTEATAASICLRIRQH